MAGAGVYQSGSNNVDHKNILNHMNEMVLNGGVFEEDDDSESD